MVLGDAKQANIEARGMNGLSMRNNAALVICLGAVFSLAPFAIDMYLPALPSMAESLATTIDDVEATVTIFLLGYALSQLILGPLSDRVGRMQVLLGGLALFVVGGVLCGTAATPNELYVYRFLQAIGGGASVVVFALVHDRFDEKGSAQVISYIMAVVVVAPLVAPIIGAYVLVGLGWEWIFYGLAGYGALTLAATKLVVRDSEKRSKPAHISFSTSVNRLLTTYGSVLANGTAMAHILTGAFAFSGLFAFVAGSPFVYIEYFGVAPNIYGYLVGANAAVMIAMNLLNARVLYDIRPTHKVIVGAFIIGGASSALLMVNAAGLGLAWVVAGVMAFVGVLGLISANAIAGALASFSDRESGTASAVYGVCQFGLGALSSAVVSWLPSDDATVMVGVMAACGFLALLSALPLCRAATRTATVARGSAKRVPTAAP